jgi:ABC-type transport system involved in multi-copper enzyme maturation permease subunit
MPIYANVYRKRDSPLPLRRWRFLPITRETLRALIARRLLLLGLFAAWLPFFGMVLYIVGTRFLFKGMIQAPPFDSALLARWLGWQTLVAAFLTTFIGSGLIARDLRAGGLVLYLSRSLTRRDYVIGKLLVPAMANLMVTCAPTALLIAIGAMLDTARASSLASWSLAAAALLHTLVVSIFLALIVLALSALARSGALAGFLFFLITVPLDAMIALAARALDTPLLALASPRAGLHALAGVLLGQSHAGDTLFAAHMAALLAMAAGAILILRLRLRPEESVA